MLVDLAVAPVEQARPVLHARFDGPRRPHLASAEWRIAGVAVTAGILAASHQVVAHGHFVETVACDLDDGIEVADGTTADGPGRRFASRIETLDRVALRRLVDGYLADDPGRTVIGRFPTDPLALTVVTRLDDGWATVHTYPTADGATVVHTRTELVP